jgi:hypothetical protein
VRDELHAMFVRQMAARRVYRDCELPPFLQSCVYADFRASCDEAVSNNCPHMAHHVIARGASLSRFGHETDLGLGGSRDLNLGGAFD